jgi:hypothetical protein
MDSETFEYWISLSEILKQIKDWATGFRIHYSIIPTFHYYFVPIVSSRETANLR